jgi:hypothetical protein
MTLLARNRARQSASRSCCFVPARWSYLQSGDRRARAGAVAA